MTSTTSTTTEQLKRYVAILKVPADTVLGYTEERREVAATAWYVAHGGVLHFYVSYQGDVFVAGPGTWARVEEAVSA